MSLRGEFAIQVGSKSNGTARGVVGNGRIAHGSHFGGDIANESTARDCAFGLCLQEAVAVAVAAVFGSNVGVERVKVDVVLLSGGGHHHHGASHHDKGGGSGEQAAKYGGGSSHHDGSYVYFFTTALLAFPFICQSSNVSAARVA